MLYPFSLFFFSLFFVWASYEHVVYALDGLIYTLTYWPKEASDICRLEQLSTTPTKMEEANEIRKKYGIDTDEPKNIKFFLRSESVRNKEEVEKSNEQFFATASSPGPGMDPYQEAFPFAKQPHLLRPFASKQQLFSTPHTSLDMVEGGKSTSDRLPGVDGNDVESMEGDEETIISYSHLNKRYS